MEVVLQVGAIVLAVVGAGAAVFGLAQGMIWLRGEVRRIRGSRLGGKGRVFHTGEALVLRPGDASRFVRDIEFVDGTLVAPGQRFRKTWEIQNVGSVMWSRRYLQRIGAPEGPGLIKSPVRVPIPVTPPGAQVEMTIDLEAPATEGTCTAYFKMADERGELLFPDRYPQGIFVTANVVKPENRGGVPG